MAPLDNNTKSSPYTFRPSDIREDFERKQSPRITNRKTNTPYSRKKKKKQGHGYGQDDDVDENDTTILSDTIPVNVNNNDQDDFLARFVHGSCQRYLDRPRRQQVTASTEAIVNHNNNNNKTSMSSLQRSDSLSAFQERKSLLLCSNVGKFCNDDLLCQSAIDDHLDFFTHCRQPLSFLSFFHEHDHHNNNAVDNYGDDEMMMMESMHAGAYLMSKECEYCGSHDVKLCPETCQRPKLYFQKKRPPFAKSNARDWDSITENYIPSPSQQIQQQQHQF